jgi:uncharacterized membrane protein YczE
MRGLPRREVVRRLPRLVAALVSLGIAIALMVRADLGLSPWDVLHQGISERTGVPIGTVGIFVGFVVLLAWIPLRERIGVGTVLNVLILGVTIDIALATLPHHPNLPTRWLELLAGTFFIGPGAALYLSCGLGAGPRDGVMTALVDRGWSMRVIRTLMELTVLVAGWLLGGTVGIGTVLFAFTVGPNLHWFTDRVRLPGVTPEPAPTPATAAD